MIFCPIMCMYISCVGLCVHGFMNPLPSWFVCVFFLRCFNILCYASGFYMLLFVVRCLWCARVRARVCVIHWHCSAHLSMFNMEKRYRNKIIIIIIYQFSSKWFKTSKRRRKTGSHGDTARKKLRPRARTPTHAHSRTDRMENHRVNAYVIVVVN